jgi:hypothetical protein
MSKSSLENGVIRIDSGKTLGLNPEINFYDAHGNLSTDKTDLEIAQDIWKEFMRYNEYIEKSGLFVHYPAREFYLQGIPSPRQVIAWRKLIRMLGAENFCNLPFFLNYLENNEVLFKEEFTKRFGSLEDLKDIEVTFTCGYYWRLNERRREMMMNFVVDNILAKGATVKIWTQDKTLREDFKRMLQDKECKPAIKRRLHIHRKLYRMDMHYTLAKDKKNPDNSYLSMELIHTEAHDFRLETYLTFGQLETYCNRKRFMGVLSSHQKFHLKRRLLSWFNYAHNYG